MRKIISIILFFLLAINVFYATSGVLNFPMQSMDTIGIWMLKAKAISLGPETLHMVLYAPVFIYSHPQYPLLLPFVFSTLGSVLGTFHEFPGLLLSPLIYVFVLFFCFKTLRLRVPFLLALLLTYVYSMFGPLLSEAGRMNAGNADIYICLLVWLGLYIQVRFPNTTKSLVFCALCVAVASQIKMEGVFFGALLFLQSSPLKRKILPLLIAFTPALLWIVIVHISHISASPGLSVPQLLTLLPNSMIILIGTFREFLNLNNWYIFWFVFALLLIQMRRPFFAQHMRIVLVMGIIYGAYCMTYLLSAASIDIS